MKLTQRRLKLNMYEINTMSSALLFTFKLRIQRFDWTLVVLKLSLGWRKVKASVQCTIASNWNFNFFFYLHKFLENLHGVRGVISKACSWIINQQKREWYVVKTPVVYRMSRNWVFQILQGVYSSRACSLHYTLLMDV